MTFAEFAAFVSSMEHPLSPYLANADEVRDGTFIAGCRQFVPALIAVAEAAMDVECTGPALTRCWDCASCEVIKALHSLTSAGREEGKG